MSLLRFVARSLFAGQFIADGVRAVAHPAEIAPDAERLTSTIAPLVQRVVPAHLASSVPENTETWVRMIGAAQIVGGSMFATGLGRRLGAGLLTATSAAHLVAAWPERNAPAAAKESARGDVLRGAALLGATALAAMDTQGRPSLSYRADQAAKATGRKASDVSDDVSKAAKSLSAKAEKKTKKVARQARREAKRLGKKLDAVTSR